MVRVPGWSMVMSWCCLYRKSPLPNFSWCSYDDQFTLLERWPQKNRRHPENLASSPPSIFQFSSLEPLGSWDCEHYGGGVSCRVSQSFWCFFWRKNPLIEVLAFSEIFGLWRILRDLGKISLPWYSQEDHSFQCSFLVTPSHWEETMMIFPVYMLGHGGCHVPRSKRWFSTRLTLDAWGRVSRASVDGMARVAWMVEGGRIWDGTLWH